MNTTSSNETSLQNQRPYSDDYVCYITVTFLISLIIIFLNGVVLILYMWKRQILLVMHYNWLLFNLSICDFLKGIFVTLNIVGHVHPAFKNNNLKSVLTYRIVVDTFTTFLLNTNIMLLCGITIDRFVSIFYALRYMSIINGKSTTRYLILTWCLPFLASSAQLMWLYQVIIVGMSQNVSKMVAELDIWYSVVLFILFLAIPVGLLGTLFIIMFFRIRLLLRNTPPHHVKKISEKQRRVVYVFGSMYLSFVILAMPYFTLRLWNDILCMTNQCLKINKRLFYVIITLKRMTSVVNPFMYTLSSPEFRKVLKQIREKLRYHDRGRSLEAERIENEKKLFMMETLGRSSILESRCQ